MNVFMMLKSLQNKFSNTERKTMNKPVKVIKTPVTIQQAIEFAKAVKIRSDGELARAEACVKCCYVGQGCDPLCPHL